MSKSLKNFITIRQALQQNTARQIRFCFLRHKYNAPMDYGDNTMDHAITTEKLFVEFFHNVKANLRRFASLTSQEQKWEDEEYLLQGDVATCKIRVDESLRDDFDTPTALAALADLVKATNIYIESKAKKGGVTNSLVLRNSAVYITKIFKVFGLVSSISDGEIGFDAGANASDANGASKEEILEPILDALMTFRSNVRNMARNQNIKGVLDQCDTFRDDSLPPLGIRLEDKSAAGGVQQSVWKLDNPETLMKERQLKEQEKIRKQEEKEARSREEKEQELKNSIPPIEFMKSLLLEDGVTPKYKSETFDDEGIPTHFYNGEELSKNDKKRAVKEFKSQKTKFDKWYAKQKHVVNEAGVEQMQESATVGAEKVGESPTIEKQKTNRKESPAVKCVKAFFASSPLSGISYSEQNSFLDDKT